MSQQNNLSVESMTVLGFCQVIKTALLPGIVAYLNSTRTLSSPVTIDELYKVLLLPSVSNSFITSPSQSQFIPMNPINQFNPVNSVNSVVEQKAKPKTKARGKDSNVELPDEMRCNYVFTRGESKHTRCTSQVEPGEKFCKPCGNKRGAKGGAQKQNDKTSTQSFDGQKFSYPSDAQNVQHLKIKSLPDGNYLHEETNLVLKNTQIGDGTSYICTGYLDQINRRVLPPTKEHIELCKKLNISYVDPNTLNDSTRLPPSQGFQNNTNLTNKPLLPGTMMNTLHNTFVSNIPPSLPGGNSYSIPGGIPPQLPGGIPLSLPGVPSVGVPSVGIPATGPSMGKFTLPGVTSVGVTSVGVPSVGVSSVNLPTGGSIQSSGPSAGMSLPGVPSVGGPSVPGMSLPGVPAVGVSSVGVPPGMLLPGVPSGGGLTRAIPQNTDIFSSKPNFSKPDEPDENDSGTDNDQSDADD